MTQIITKIWTTAAGSKIPIQLMGEQHIRMAFRLCCLVEMYDKEHSHKDENIIYYDGKTAAQHREQQATTMYGVAITLSEAKRWIPIFLEEAKRRNLVLRRPDQLDVKKLLKKRKVTKQNMRDNFNEKFK